METHDIGLIGLAVMGQNLVLNMERNGYRVAVYNRTTSTTTAFIEGAAAGKNITGTSSLKEFIGSLKRPRKVMLMVKAGAPVDAVIAQLTRFLETGDIIIDGGNSFYKDTERRSKMLAVDGIHYLGTGVSGGEEGALHGPSIMPGGPPESYTYLKPLFESIAAKVEMEPCVAYIGPRGSGHFVKMVHNGIEYGDMQLIAEAYDILKRGCGLSAKALGDIFDRWNEGPLSSYLIEITSDIFKVADPETGSPLVEMILDTAGQKGTGRWTSQIAMDLGVPTPTINAAVEARVISAYKTEREDAAKAFTHVVDPDIPDHFVGAVEDALYMAKICSYAQGMALLKQASQEYAYDLKYSEIARIWRGGCIIRAQFLDDIRASFENDPELTNLLLAPFFQKAVSERADSLRLVLKTAIHCGIPMPAMSASLAYYDAYRSARLPANLIQAQRDYFGAHTYERIDRKGIFHTEWKINI
jgi:6-phosphogluconate dehydrogenase